MGPLCSTQVAATSVVLRCSSSERLIVQRAARVSSQLFKMKKNYVEKIFFWMNWVSFPTFVKNFPTNNEVVNRPWMKIAEKLHLMLLINIIFSFTSLHSIFQSWLLLFFLSAFLSTRYCRHCDVSISIQFSIDSTPSKFRDGNKSGIKRNKKLRKRRIHCISQWVRCTYLVKLKHWSTASAPVLA